MVDLADLDDWADNQLKAYSLSISEQAQITRAGAEVLRQHIADYLKSHHYTNRKTGEESHLADSVIADAVNELGKVDGSSMVGFPPEKGYIARFLNDGTKYIKGDDFIDKVRSACLDEIFQAENAEFHKILKQKGLDS